jgi:hypothetical protein
MCMTLQLLYNIKRVHNFIFLKLLKVFINLQIFLIMYSFLQKCKTYNITPFYISNADFYINLFFIN